MTWSLLSIYLDRSTQTVDTVNILMYTGSMRYPNERLQISKANTAKMDQRQIFPCWH